MKESQTTFIELLGSLPKDDPDYALFSKFLSHINATIANEGTHGVMVYREGFTDVYSGEYYMSENGGRIFQGMRKIVDGKPEQVRPALIGEMAILLGSGVTELKPPKGWQIIDDSDIQNRYNIGNPPFWKAVAIKYIGI